MSPRSRRSSVSLPTLTSETFEPLLSKLAAEPNDFTPADLAASFDHLFSPNSSTEAQIGAFLALLRASGLEGKPEMMSIAAQSMRERAVRVELEESGWADLVGTGGDGKDTFNVSTTAAIVAAGAGVKHGARASSSASGSADVLLALGVPITSLPLSRVPAIAASLSKPFLFLFAPLCHPALALVAPIRRQLGHPTIFNVLGPLLNPARPEYMIVGVHSRYLGPAFAQALRALKVKRAWVVNGDEGLDEISPEGTSHIWELRDGQISERVISPATFGLQSHPLSNVAGGKPKENAALIVGLLSGEIPHDHPVENFVMMNAAALLVVAGKADNEQHGVELARAAIKSGAARAALQQYKDLAVAAVKEEEDDDAQSGR
ncbi:anthranilate phosphoribosyltransferase [Cystobasidiomycetes sp. EMM_F5]